MLMFVEKIGLEKFRRQFADAPTALAWLEANLFEADDARVRLLLEEVDDSTYSLREWIDALVVMGEWLDARGLKAGIEDQIGFVSCANASAGAGASISVLSGIVSDMLDQYGFERAVAK